MPGITSGVALNPDTPVTPQLYGRAKVSHFFEGAHTAPSFGVGLMQPATYQNDSDDLFQYDHRAPNGPSLRRVDFTEGAEVKTGGNGLTGNDETSEEFGDGAGGNGTFEAAATVTPGTIQ